MEEIEERLTEEVRKHVHLYDALSPHYKDSQMASVSWKEISTSIGIDVAECTKRWKTLRDKFVRHHKKMEAKSGKPGAKRLPTFYLLLSWLAPHIKHRGSNYDDKESAVSSSAAEDAPVKNVAEDQDVCPLSPVEPASPALSSPTRCEGTQTQTSISTPLSPQSPHQKAQKRKQRDEDDWLQKQIAQLEKRKVELVQKLLINDEEPTRFGQTVADMLRRVPEEHRSQAMFDVYKLLFERQQLNKSTSKDV